MSSFCQIFSYQNMRYSCLCTCKGLSGCMGCVSVLINIPPTAGITEIHKYDNLSITVGGRQGQLFHWNNAPRPIPCHNNINNINNKWLQGHVQNYTLRLTGTSVSIIYLTYIILIWIHLIQSEYIYGHICLDVIIGWRYVPIELTYLSFQLLRCTC